MQRRRFLVSAFAASTAGLLPRARTAVAQPVAGMQIRLIVPFPSGGPSDIVARPFAELLGDALRSVVIVDNRAGAGGTIGADAAEPGWPHAVLCHGGDARPQSHSLQTRAIRCRARFHADCPSRGSASGDHCKPGAVCEQSRRTYSPCKARARQTHLWLRWQWNAWTPNR